MNYKHEEYVHKHKWFAWYPVKTIEGVWVWWDYVTKVVDERPLVYCGLLESITYEQLNKE